MPHDNLLILEVILQDLDAWSGQKAGRVAKEAENDKVKKYAPMSRDFYMVPICVETTEVWGPSVTNSSRNMVD